MMEAPRKSEQPPASASSGMSYSAIANTRHTSLSRSHATGLNQSVTTSSSTMRRSRRASLEADIPEIKQAVENRSRSRREMQELNERLGGFIEKTRYLQAQNKKLKDELTHLKSRWGRETEKVKAAYEAELQQMRRLLDEAERLKGEKDARLATYEAQISEIRDLLTKVTNQNEQQSEQLDRCHHELADRDGEIALLRRRQAQTEEDRARLKQYLAKVKDDLGRLHTDLETESAARISSQTENQTLREELQFLKHVHEQELKELRALIKTDEDDSREFWKSELSMAIHDMQKEYDDKVDSLRVELESIYMTKMRELAKGTAHGSSETSYLKEESKKLKETIADLRRKVSDLMGRNEQLERAAEDMRREAEAERRRHSEEQERLVADLARSEADLRRVLNELQALMDTKISLELEIAAYKKLLDAEGVALDSIDGSRAGSFRSSEKPSVVMEQRVERRTDINNGGSISAVTGEMTARTQFEKTFKGSVCIEDCAPDGSFVQLRNVGAKKETLIGWRISRTIDSRAKPQEYQLPGISISPGQACRLWARGERPSDADEGDVEVDVRKWPVGRFAMTALINAEGQERARHVQKTFVASPV